jgi:four helix bundle protein
LLYKEASETKYWLRLLLAAEILEENEQKSIFEASVELEKILTAIVKTTSGAV